MMVRNIAHDIPKELPREPSSSQLDSLTCGSRCPFAPACPLSSPPRCGVPVKPETRIPHADISVSCTCMIFCIMPPSHLSLTPHQILLHDLKLNTQGRLRGTETLVLRFLFILSPSPLLFLKVYWSWFYCCVL